MMKAQVSLVCASALLAASALLLGCATTSPPNQGQSGRRMDPTRDSASEIGTTQLRSADLVTATDMMARDIAARDDINDPANPPIFFVGPIINETSQPHQNYQIFLNRLRAVLNASGTRSGLDIRQNRQFVQRMRQLEYGTTDDPDSGQPLASENEYVLTCIVQDMPTRGTNYYLLEYQLVQLKDYATSGPNRGVGSIVWSNFYEVKFN